MSGGGHGLGLLMAIIFLAGEMAGVGVLALPRAMVGTGPAGIALIIYFTANAMFAGSRLGLCWVMVTERFPEFKEGVSKIYKYVTFNFESFTSADLHTWLLLRRLQETLESMNWMESM